MMNDAFRKFATDKAVVDYGGLTSRNDTSCLIAGNSAFGTRSCQAKSINYFHVLIIGIPE
jgi:hypothetical protein